MAGKTIIVTGASRGIGLAIAKKIIQEGHNAIVLARSTKALTEFQNECPKQVRILPGDMRDFSLAQSAVDLALQDFGQLDGLIINHGTMGQIDRIEDCDLDGWKWVFDVNFFSAVAFAKAALPALRKTSGCILLTSSGASTGAYSAWGAYSASKAAMNQLAAQLACEEPQLTTLSIRPGVVDTDMQKELRDTHYSKMAEKDNKKFQGLHESRQLLRPEQPGHVMAKVVLDPPKKLSGRYLNWESVELEAYQEEWSH